MSRQIITGSDFIEMMLTAAEHLRANVDKVNALNVFPVPDGDTGTNMNLTLTSGVQELQSKSSSHLGKAAEALSKGLLMGARGNSGVILSQLFRGFAKSVAELEQADASQLAAAFQSGVDTAYKAVVKPVEGTILTVSKEAAKDAARAASQSDIEHVLEQLICSAKEALARTPDQLPILKQVGVVDAGGQGLVHIYEGFLEALGTPSGERKYASVASSSAASAPLAMDVHEHRSAQSHLSTEDIEFGYCTEFIIKMTPDGQAAFQEEAFREALSAHGDSLLVVADDDLVKVHIHAEYPGNVMNHAMQYGDLTRIKIENMREQHSEILAHDHAHADTPVLAKESAPVVQADVPLKAMGMVAVAAGEGLRDVFLSIGVDQMLSGGQTMNPSTEDIVKAAEAVHAETIFVFPNNSNIILAAEQAKALVEGKQIIVIPTKTIPQGLSAALTFREDVSPEQNEAAMNAAVQQVRSGSITYAVRDSNISGLTIHAGDYLAMLDSQIVTSGPDFDHVIQQLIDQMVDSGDEIITIFAGEDATEEQTAKLEEYLTAKYPDAEAEFHNGGQPLYYYLISVE